MDLKSESESVEYLQLLDTNRNYDEEEIEMETNENQIEYIEAEKVPDGHVITMHDGRQYMIPSELSESGQTIVLDNGDGEEYILQEAPTNQTGPIFDENETRNDDLQPYYVEGNEGIVEMAECEQQNVSELCEEEEEDCFLVYEDDTNPEVIDNELSSLNQQYAVIQDGKLHIQTHPDDNELTMVEQEEENSNPVNNNEITGRNLITGQTISLNGFLEKIKQNSGLDFTNYPEILQKKKRNNSEYQQQRDFVLVPPVNKRGVVVGKTSDGRNVVGKILQIQKKIPDPVPKPTRRRKLKDAPSSNFRRQKLRPELQAKNVIVKRKYVTKAFLDHSIVRTISGLMDMESIERNLSEKNLIIKHVLKRSSGGTVFPGREITYYYGHMEKVEASNNFHNTPQWTFVSNGIGSDDDDDDDDSKSIDLRQENEKNRQQIDPDDESIVMRNKKKSNKNQNFEQTITINLIVTQDESGKKRTQVVIPELGGSTTKCHVCNRTFRSELFRRHGCFNNNNNNNKLSTTPTKSNDNNSTTSACSYTCELCKRTFTDMNALFRHSRTHSSDAAASASTKTAQQQQHICHVCGKAFNASGSLRRHITVHNPELRPLQCLTCMQRFTDESSLKKHMLTHTGIKPYQCDVCLKSFAQQGDLNFHRRNHNPLKLYQCIVCGKEFNRLSNLVRHEEIHRALPVKGGGGAAETVSDDSNDSDENRPALYICEVCGCQYNFMSSLTRHIVTNHLNKDENNSETVQNADSVSE